MAVRPTRILSGDTHAWTTSSADYPASDGYTLKVTITNSTNYIQATAATNSNGEDYDVTLTAVQTGQLAAGVYTIVEAVESGSGASIVRHTVYTGQITVDANVAGLSSHADVRTHARKVLDAIEAAIEGRATRGQLESTVIGDRQVQYLAPEELLKWRSFYKGEVAREEAAAKVAQGLDGGNRIFTRFPTGGW